MVMVVVNPGYHIRDKANRRDAGPGMEIDVPEKEARILKSLGRASDPKPRDRSVVPPVVPVPVMEMPVVSQVAELPPDDVPVSPPVVDEAVPVAETTPVSPVRSRYVRRDMRATEEQE